MNLFDRLREKSWQTPGVEGYSDPASYRPESAVVGMYVYIAVATALITLIMAAYLVRMGLPGTMEHGSGDDWLPMPEPPLLWINTAILVASSLAWEIARRAARRHVKGRALYMSIAGAVLGLAFMSGQLLLWRQFQAEGYYLAANPAAAFFYLLTAVHGLHLAGGVIASTRAFSQLGIEGEHARAFRNIRLCAVYWHFLLLVWVLLAGLLVST